VQGETKAGSPCAMFCTAKCRDGEVPPLCVSLLGRFLPALSNRLGGLLGLLFGSELLLYLEGDGIGVHLVRAGCITEDSGHLPARPVHRDLSRQALEQCDVSKQKSAKTLLIAVGRTREFRPIPPLADDRSATVRAFVDRLLEGARP